MPCLGSTQIRVPFLPSQTLPSPSPSPPPAHIIPGLQVWHELKEVVDGDLDRGKVEQNVQGRAQALVDKLVVLFAPSLGGHVRQLLLNRTACSNGGEP